MSLSKDEGRMDICVYMLHCADGSYYVGLTRAGLDKRVGEHEVVERANGKPGRCPAGF